MKYPISYNWGYRQRSGFGWVVVTITGAMTEEALTKAARDIAVEMAGKSDIDPEELTILPLFWRPF